jgi:NAD/NADP transhydrogenase beta subunit
VGSGRGIEKILTIQIQEEDERIGLKESTTNIYLKNIWSLMEIPLEIIIGVVGIIGSIIAYCIRIELKLKDLENEIKILEPLKRVLEKKGTDHVIKIFEEQKP